MIKDRQKSFQLKQNVAFQVQFPKKKALAREISTFEFSFTPPPPCLMITPFLSYADSRVRTAAKSFTAEPSCCCKTYTQTPIIKRKICEMNTWAQNKSSYSSNCSQMLVRIPGNIENYHAKIPIANTTSNTYCASHWSTLNLQCSTTAHLQLT